ncbi:MULTISPECIES: nucleoside transporter C-terminal domain-containing protein [unclassified Exiguobacterium]|uniref:NupC/NupG family nucleoside CNT transporter n=1 Tax=unclassified Exiguobacterium TaxID=2644629 RepID=UPI001BEC5CD4|nr:MULTISPECIES: nucleoside transporter C-terminal domain-containing protein [unclassified Exiguobacterium]
MTILYGILGIVAFLGLAFLLSNDKKNINFKAVGVMLGLQVATTLFLLKTSIGMKVIEAVAGAIAKAMSYGMDGVNFVVGGFAFVEGGSVFFINVLLIIVFTSTLLSILTYIGVLPLLIKYLGGFLSKVTGLPKIETFNAANSVFFGQSEALLAVKSHLPKLNNNRMFIISTSAMASVSASIIGAYMTMLEPKYVLVAMILNMFNGLIIGSIIAPVKSDKEDEEIDIKSVRKQAGTSLFDAIGNGALDGGKVALIVGAMLVAFIGLVSMVNAAFMGMFGISFQEVLGFVFAPIAFLMGVPTGDLLTVGNLMGTKLVANEFVAMLDLLNVQGNLTEKGLAIVSVFLTSFAAVGSIGIISGTVAAINKAKAQVVASFGLKMLLAATLVSLVSATVVGIFI